MFCATQEMILVLIIFLLRICHAKVEVEFFKDENFRGVSLYSVERITTSCETLPSMVQSKAKSIKTNSCIILYSNEDCQGSFFPVEAGNHPELRYFKNLVQSYRTCTDVRKDEPWRDLRIKLYLHFRSNEILWDAPIIPECVTLPTMYRNRASSLKADLCVILFSEPNCSGRRFQVEAAGYDSDLKDFNDELVSFMPCNVTDVYKTEFSPAADEPNKIKINSEFQSTSAIPEPWQKMEIKLYSDSSSNEVLWETKITPDCVTLPMEFRNEASTVKADICVVLFSEPGCIGRRFKVEAAGYRRDLLDFNDDLESFKPCNAFDMFKIATSSDAKRSDEFYSTYITAENSVKSRVELFQDEKFQESLYTAEMVTTTCVTLPSRTWNQVSSIKTEGCIILYSHGLCRGSYFVLEAGDHPNLQYFDNQVKSYRACTDVRKTQIIEQGSKDKPRIRLYDQHNYDGLLLDQPISPNCNRIPQPLRNRASSIKSDICVILFSETDCNGSRFVVGEFLWDNSLEYFQDKLQSFIPCNLSDVFNKPKVKQATVTTKPHLVQTPTAIAIEAEATTMSQKIATKSHNISEQNVADHQDKEKLVSESPFDSGNILVTVFLVLLIILGLLLVWIGLLYRDKHPSIILRRGLYEGVANDEKTLWSPGRPLIEP